MEKVFLFKKCFYICTIIINQNKPNKMKYQLTLTRKSDGKVFIMNFKTKKNMQRFQSNNYTIYTW